MDEELADSIRLAAQWFFGPLLALVALAWLCVRLEASGVFDVICSAVRKMPIGRRIAFFALAAGLIAFAGTKTNSPPMNLPGPILPPSVLVPVLPGLSPLSCGLPAPLPAEPFAVPPDGATTNTRWRVRGAFEDAVRIPFPGEDGFPWRGGVATALTAFACGEFRPDAATEYFPAPFVDPVSLPPLGRQDADAPSAFWHAATPSNSLVVTWENALHGRDAACPTNFQAEFFADGSFIYRYPDHATRYPPVLPFDYDGDGLENSVDPEPEVPGPDAHGTNAQWYNTVCSNIFVAAEATNCVPPVSLAWKGGVNSNAYYFVDVVAERGPAPIRFMDANGAMPDDPVVVARAGEVCRVPLVVGVEYAVTSSVPFTVSPAYDTIGRTPDYTLIIAPREGGGTTVHWPIRFSYVEKSGSTTEFTLSSSPSGLELEYHWRVEGGMPPQQMPMLMSPFPRLLSGGGSACFDYAGSNVTMICVGNCGCNGCTLEGDAEIERHLVSLPTFQCGCESTHEPDPEAPDEPPDPSRPSISVSYSAPAVIYEAAYVDTPGLTVPRRSTPVSFTISVSGGPRGGHYSVSMPGFGRVVPTEPVDIPVNGDLGSYETVCFSATCEGCAPSSSKDDVGISGRFVENETGCRFTSNGSNLTVFKVELQPKVDPPDQNYAFVNRHRYGIRELVRRFQTPSSPILQWNYTGGGRETNDAIAGETFYQCPLSGCQNPISASYAGIQYTPLVEIVEPTDIMAEYRNGRTMGSVFTANTVTLGMAGGIGMYLKLYVMPFSVSFSQISVQEVVSFTYEAEGYFLNPYFNGAFAHTGGVGGAGAGTWFDVDLDNLFAVDIAAYRDYIPWLTPDGHPTNDVAFTWTSGYVYIDNPFGWNEKDTNGDTSPFRRFGESIRDEIMLDSNGTVGVRKLNKQVIRTTNNVIRIGGVLVQ